MRGRRAPGPLILALLGGLLLVGGLVQSAAAQLVFTPASLSAQIAVKGTAFSLTLPTAAHRTDTTGSVTAYSISPTLPTSLSLDTMNITAPKITGTPSETTDDATDYTLTATYTFTDSTTTTATLTFSLAVKNIAFVDGTTVPHFTRLILTLPWAGTGCTAPLTQYALPTAAGQGTVTYTLDDDSNANTPLDLPTGLSFNADPPRIDVDNTQIAVTTDATTYTLKATDAATPTTNTTSLAFDLEVVNEKAILESFYTVTGGDDWSTKSNWGSSISVCPGQLHGVTAANGRVTEIDLDHNNLTGTLFLRTWASWPTSYVSTSITTA